MTKAFISYSRKDSAFTRTLADALLAEKHESWVDWESIPPTVDWKEHIRKGIEDSDVFIFLISPDSIKSHECNGELHQALQNGKRIIPLVIRDVDPEATPREISHINWIFFDQEHPFEQSFRKLLEAMHTDYEWVQLHRRLQTKALEWSRADKDKSFLLRGKDLDYAEGQLLVNASKDPKPTDLQREYILKSRHAAAQQRRTITGVAIGVAIVMVFLTVFALISRQDAVNNEAIAMESRAIAQINAEIANSKAKLAAEKELEASQNALIAQIGEISSRSLGRLNQDLNESLLYSVEAYNRAAANGFNLERAKSALITALQNQPGLVKVLPAHGDWVQSVVYSRDGALMASSSWEGIAYLWDNSNPLNPVKRAQFFGDDVAIQADARLLATSEFDDQRMPVIKLWDISYPSAPALLSQFEGNFIIDFLPDGNYLVIQHIREGEEIEEGEEEFYIKIWDVSDPAKPALAARIVGTDAILNGDGNLLAVSHADTDGNTVISLWDLSVPRQPVHISDLTGDFEVYVDDFDLRPVFAFSPDGQMIAISAYDDSGNAIVSLWDISNAAEPTRVNTFSGNADTINALAFSPDGTHLALGSNMGKIALWEISDPHKPYWSPSSATLTGHPLAVSAMAFTPNGKTLATGSYDGTLMLWDMSDTRNPLRIHAPAGETLAFNKQGDLLVAAEYDEEQEKNQTVLWDLTDLSAPKKLLTLDINTYEAALSEDNRLLVTAVYDEESETGATLLWDISNPANPISHQLLDVDGYGLTFSPDHQVLLITMDDEEAGSSITSLWDISNSEKPEKFGEIEDALAFAKFRPDNQMLVTSDSTNEELEFWDISTPGKFSQLGKMEGGNVTFNSDNRTIAILIRYLWEETRDVQVWDIPNWADRKQVGLLKGSNNATFSPDGRMLATTLNDDKKTTYTILLWNLSDLKQPLSAPLEGHTRFIDRLAFSPNGQILASTGDDKTIILWDISNPRSPARGITLSGHTDWVTAISFSPDGSMLASGSYDHHILLWNVTSYEKTMQSGDIVSEYNDQIISLGFASHTRLVSNDARLWDIDPRSWATKACEMAGSNFTPEKWKLAFPNTIYEPTCPNIRPEAVAITHGNVVSLSVQSSFGLSECTQAIDVPASCLPSAVRLRDQFCVDKMSYSLYGIPEGSTLTPLDSQFTCKNEGQYGGALLYSCSGPPMNAFEAKLCNAACSITQSEQCDTGFGLDPTGSCCAPIASDADACITVTLEIKDCTAIR